MPVRRSLVLVVAALLAGGAPAGCGGRRSVSTGTTLAARAAPTSAGTAVSTTSGLSAGPAPASTPVRPVPTGATPGRPGLSAPHRPATTAAPPAGCVVGPQAPPAAAIAADFATALAFAPDGRLFYAERSGSVRVFQGGATRLFAAVATVTTESGGGYSERGLLGLAVDPDFGENHYVYALYSDPDRVHQEIVRWTDCAGVSGPPTVIIRLPAGPDCCHKGGRLAFGPDRHLYVTLGEEHVAPAAQDPSDVRGKVLRYNRNGTVPTDNPFGAGDPVWAYGFRNPFGIAFSASGQLAVTNNGPSGEIPGGPSAGYDTVVAAVARGGGYQWPYCYGNSHPLPGVAPGCGGQPGPDWSSEDPPSVVPTGAAFVDASGPAGYAGHLVFCTFSAGMRILTSAGVAVAGPPECRLDVKQGPDHALYYSDSGHIYRLA